MMLCSLELSLQRTKFHILDFRTCDKYYSVASVMCARTGKEYNRMAMKRSTMMRRMSPMKRHLNLLHTMNFIVLHGLVNQKKDVSGRLVYDRRYVRC